MKIFIATPAFSGKVNIQYAISLAETVDLLHRNGISTQKFITSSGSLLCAERNRILHAFLNSDCTHILCIDSDLGWPALAVKSMIDKDKDIIGGIYPSRIERSFTFRPCLNENGSLVVGENSLLKMECIPSGFLLMKKTVIQKMCEDNPERLCRPKDGNPPFYCLFNTEIINSEFWGEDYVFCILARKSGFEIWIDPFIQFDHNGTIGMFAEILRKENDSDS